MSKQNLQTLLQRIGATIGIPDLALDDDNFCQLRIGDTRDLSIECDERNEQVILTIRCGPLGEHNRAAVLQEITDANFHWVGGGGGTLSTNSREGMVYLQFRESTAQMDQARLEGLLEILIRNAEYWESRLAAASKAPAIPSDAALTGNLIPNRA